MSDKSNDEITSTPPDITEKAMVATNNLLPEKSRKIYEKFYNQFMEWRTKNNIASYSENVLIVYFEELSNKIKSPSLWTRYSIRKSTLNIKNQINIAQYPKLHALLKRKSEGYNGKKSKTFSPNEIKTFINEAPDSNYLLTKVVLIFGIMGACRRQEMHSLKFNDVSDLKTLILVTIRDTKTKTTRKFTITGKYYDVCKKYMDLRPKICTTQNFFNNYFHGKCTVQNVGINKFGSMGKTIATYLNLPYPHLYTGHCFRRSSATILVDAGGDITTLKRHGGWKSTTVAESYIDDSIQNKINVSEKILNSIQTNQTLNTININSASTSNNFPTEAIPQLHFSNCTIHNINIDKKQ
ncbi:hypothetical protein RI129_006476 [Pyrocoelia pectoralis]|uniref:Tyr recombinase domain-containing protein n=1 Tax=Pyrocoelia pectoralis TaxID=417401 RepID=A0AAN7VGH9_9COLE